MTSTPRALAIIQARMGSSRFPGKSLAEIDGKPILWYLFRQLAGCRTLDDIVLATTTNAEDDPLAAYGEDRGWAVFRGDPLDVLGRFVACARAHGAGPDTDIVRLTGDDIHSDPRLIDAIVNIRQSLGPFADFVTMDRTGRIPYGAGVEVCPFAALERADREATDARDREHVTRYIHRQPDRFRIVDITPRDALECRELSVDKPEDLAWNRRLVTQLDRIAAPPYRLADIVAAGRVLDAEDQQGSSSQGKTP